MIPSSDFKIFLAEQASYLSERLDPRRREDHIEQGWLQTEQLIHTWRQASAGGDWDRFHLRLSQDGLDLAEIRRRLAPLRCAGEGDFPAWVETLAAALTAWGDSDDDDPGWRDRYGTGNEPRPCEAVAWPFLSLAGRRLQAGARFIVDRFQDPGLADLIRPLALHLSMLATPVLQEGVRATAGNEAAGASGAGGDRGLAGFSRELREGGFAHLFREFPVLGRLMATATDQWLAAQLEFLTRLNEDWSRLGETFLAGRDPGKITTVAGGLSDRHRGGRCACALTFSSGLKIVYKPKPLQLEKLYNELLGWLNGRDPAGLDLKSLRVLVRDGYGWAEFVHPGPCRSEAEAADYFRRCGALLAVMHVLRGSDCHLENLIPAGPQPVLVDLETIFQPEVKGGEKHPARDFIDAAVLRTYLLPEARYDVAGSMVDSAGMGSIGSANSARLADTLLLPQDYEDEIAAGFREMGLRIIRSKTALLAPDGPVAAFAGQQVRLVLRSTRPYGNLLRKALHRAHLQDGARYGIHLDSLSRPWIHGADHPELWRIRKWEQVALENFDIPIFHARSDSTALPLPDGESIAGFAVKSGCQSVRDLIQNLDEPALRPQLELVRSVLRLHGGKLAATGPRDELSGALKLASGESEAQVEAALKIAHSLEATVIHVPGYGPSWFTFRLNPAIGEFHSGLMGEDLYEGRAGVALFLAAAASVSGNVRYRRLALDVLHSIGRMLEQGLIKKSLGGCGGVGSLLYVFSTCADVLASDEAMAGAASVLGAIDRPTIGSDTLLDVVSGSAGTILALARHARASGSAEAVEKAGWCVQRLLERRQFDRRGFSGWKLPVHGREGLCVGISHGAAGIALALGKYHALTQDPAAREAALETVALENRLLDPATGRWRLFEGATFADGSPLYRTNWCHGAPGIALSRLGLREALGTSTFDHDVRLAIGDTLNFAGASTDHLCCGSLGRSCALHVAGTRMGTAEPVQPARAIMHRVMQAAVERSGYVLHGNLKREPQTPGFFQGISGVGYEFLRAAFPGKLPCVLMLE